MVVGVGGVRLSATLLVCETTGAMGMAGSGGGGGVLMLAGLRTWQGSRHIEKRRGSEGEDVVMTGGSRV